MGRAPSSSVVDIFLLCIKAPKRHSLKFSLHMNIVHKPTGLWLTMMSDMNTDIYRCVKTF